MKCETSVKCEEGAQSSRQEERDVPDKCAKCETGAQSEKQGRKVRDKSVKCETGV